MPSDGRARGERGLRQLETWVTSVDKLVVGLNPFCQLQKDSERDYGGVRRFL